MLTSEKDIELLNGKWVVQMNETKDDECITAFNTWNFYSEKRIALIVGRMFVGLYCVHSKHETNESFISYFNNPMKDGSRFYRLLTVSEIEHLCNHFKGNII